MSRSGYSDDLDPWALIRYRGQVASAIRGHRGQRLLREMRDALEGMPERRLIAHALQADGDVCALGAVGRARAMDLIRIDPEDREQVGEAFDIAPQLAAEIAFVNDEWGYHQTAEQRWATVHRWVTDQIIDDDDRTEGRRDG